MQSVNQSQSSTFHPLRIIRVESLFQFALVLAHFRCLEMIVEQADDTAINLNITPETAIFRIRIDDKILLLDGVTAENSQLQQMFSLGRNRDIIIRPIRKNRSYTVYTKLIINAKLLKTENICLQISHVRGYLFA